MPFTELANIFLHGGFEILLNHLIIYKNNSFPQLISVQRLKEKKDKLALEHFFEYKLNIVKNLILLK